MTVNYQRRLERYFDRYYGEYEDSIEWYPDISENQWMFDVSELRKRVTLTCGADGKIEERLRNFDQRGIPSYFDSND